MDEIYTSPAHYITDFGLFERRVSEHSIEKLRHWVGGTIVLTEHYQDFKLPRKSVLTLAGPEACSLGLRKYTFPIPTSILLHCEPIIVKMPERSLKQRRPSKRR